MPAHHKHTFQRKIRCLDRKRHKVPTIRLTHGNGNLVLFLVIRVRLLLLRLPCRLTCRHMSLLTLMKSLMKRLSLRRTIYVFCRVVNIRGKRILALKRVLRVIVSTRKKLNRRRRIVGYMAPLILFLFLVMIPHVASKCRLVLLVIRVDRRTIKFRRSLILMRCLLRM